MGWLNFGGKKRKQAQGFGNSKQGKSRPRRKTFILEKIVTPSAGVGGWLQDFDPLHQLLGSLSLSDLHLPHFLADSGVCPIDPSGDPTNNLPPLIDFDPLGLYHDGIATQTPYNPGGAFETLPIAVIPVDPHSPNPNNPNAIRQLLDFPLASQPLLGSIDTGVSADSPYLNYANIKKGRDYVGGDDNPLLKPGEGSEHGTFMLGIIDAINKTAPKWVGRAIDSGRWADSLVEFVDAAKASGQKNAIANLSLDLTQKNADGSVTTRYELTPQERSAIEYARQNGVMLVVAAGNDSGVMSVLGQASQEFDNIFTVGAADGKNRAAYSSYGRGLDILAEGGTPDNPEWSTVGDGVGTMAGTSVATAKVAGAASLVWAANPDLSYRQVIEILEKTARDLGAPGWDDETGFGLLDVLAAVEKAKQTTPEVYNPEDFLNLTTWSKEGQVTPEERAVQVHQVQNPSGRRYYYGWLNNSNRMDRFDFTVTSKKLVQVSLKDALNNEFLEAQVSLYDDYGNSYPVNPPDPNSSYRSVTLYPGNYHLHVDKGSRYEIDPYKLTLNFNENNNISVIDESIWLPRPVISQPPVFTPPPSQPSVPIVIQPPPVDWQKIAEEQAKAELLRQQQAEAAAKAAAEATAKAAAEAAAKAVAEAAQRRRLEAEENARQAIALAYDQNKSWLGNSLNGVQIDWNTLLNSRVAAIQYFEGGYVVWNGIHAVAYQTGPGNSSATNVTPVEVRLHDLGMQYGRKEYGQYVGLSKRQDYYKFTVENLGDFYPHDLLFALRSNGVDIPLTDATIEILDAQMKPVPLSQLWQPNGQPGLSNLTGTTYYVRVKPAKDNLNYGLTLNLDSAQESLGTARPLGAIKGRRQFRDFVGNKGDGLGDYYSFSVEHPSLLHFSLSELDAGADANVELLDSNGHVVSLDSLSGKVGAKKLQPGSYYLRVNPANNTNTNYTLTMQMADELGTYTGRHEYKDRIIGGKNREAYYRLNIDAPAEELHLALSNLSADAKVELLRDNGSGIVNSTLIFPVDGSNQSGTEAEYKGYANVQRGNYLVRVYLPNSSTQAAKYDLLMNLDQAGEDWSKTRDLGMLTDIAQLSDYQFSDFVGADKGDSSDVYKFQVGDYGLVHLALKPPAGDGEANMLAANMRLQDESGKDVTFLNPKKDSGENYAAAYLQPGKSYYLTVAPTPGMITNYNLVINPAQGGNDWASARDLGVIKDGQPNKADNEEDYKLQEFVGYLNGNVDGADFYKFTIDERNVMTFGLGGLSAPTHIQLFNAANPNKPIDFSTLDYEKPDLDKRVSVELEKGTYYLKLFPDERLGKKGTNYSLAVNAEKKILIPAYTGSYYSDDQTNTHTELNQLPDYKQLSKLLLGGEYNATGGYLHDYSHLPQYKPYKAFHAGFDIGVGVGTSVSALVGGTVISLGSHGGIYVYNKELNQTFYYGHLNQVDVKKNQEIKAGQQIGLSGDAGSAGAPHLHFAVSPGKTSRWVDPTGGSDSYDGAKVKAIVKSQTLNPLNVFFDAKALGLTKLGSLGTGNSNNSKNSVATNNNFANSSNSGTFPYIEITSAGDSLDGDTILTPGGAITIKGKSRDIETEIVKIYLGDNLLFSEITIDGENFVGSLKVPVNISEGTYQLKARIPDKDIDIYGPDIHIQNIPSDSIDYEDLYIKQVSQELLLIDKIVAASTTWIMTAEEMLAKYKSFLRSAAAYYGIDGRAIAGAIMYEYEVNTISRLADPAVYHVVQSTGNVKEAKLSLGDLPPKQFNGVGWGKMHWETARDTLRRTLSEEKEKAITDSELAKLLALAPSAIDLIARYMKIAADIYKEYAGVDIHARPEILTTLYHSYRFQEEDQKKPDITKMAKALGERRKQGIPPLEPQVADMGLWVESEIKKGRLEDYRTVG